MGGGGAHGLLDRLEERMRYTHHGFSAVSRCSRVRVAPLALALLLPVSADAHVSITPRESMHGATERYTVRIPTEGKVATTSAELEVPEGVIVETLQAPAGWTYDITRKDDRIATITFKTDVKPGEFIEVGFVARNPREGTQIVWTLRQRFADGTVTDWTKGPSGIRPTAVTTLRPAPPRPRQ
jgi:uncharacterized protein YcnI